MDDLTPADGLQDQERLLVILSYGLYLISVAGGPRIYFTGDTDYNDILGLSVAPHRPDVMVTVINSAFRNLSPREAAQLAKTINPRWVVPCHHDIKPSRQRT